MQLSIAIWARVLIAATLLGSGFQTTVHAAQTTPYTINYQGRLTNSSGTAMADGSYNMTFRLYSALTGGTAVWTEVHDTTTRVAVTSGQFNVQLGTVSALSPALFTSQPLYFEVELPSPATATCSTAACATYTEGPMTPRQPLGSSAYAMNSDTLDGIDGSSFAQYSTTNTFTGSNTFNGTVTLGSTNSAAKLVVNDNSGNALLTADTNSTIVKMGLPTAATLANVRLLTTSGEFNTAVRVGTATNGVDINATSGVVLNGTARHTQTILLTPEYANAVLDPGSGSNNTGTMTAKYDLTNRRNYYKWTTTSGTNQSYDVVVQVPIPSDFSAWASTTPITIDTYSSDLTNGLITVAAIDSAGTAVSGINFASITPSAATAWQTKSAGTISGTFTAGDYMTLRLRLQSPSAGDVRVGTIKLNYLSQW